MKLPAAAMVLAAGRGERMRPLSLVTPKPALPLPDGPVVGSALRLAAASAAPRIVVNTWHLADRMEAALLRLPLAGGRVAVSREPALLGTAGGLARARDAGLLGERGPVLVVNGDCVLDLDLSALMARHAAGHDLVTLALIPHLDPCRWSRVELRENGTVAAIRPPGRVTPSELSLLYPGVMLVAREALDALPDGPADVGTALWGPARTAGRLGGAVVTGQWREVGTPEDYRELVLGRVADAAVVDAGAVVAGTAEVESSFVGRGCSVGESARILRSILVEGAAVGAGATVVDSLLAGDVVVAAAQPVRGELRAEPHAPGGPAVPSR